MTRTSKHRADEYRETLLYFNQKFNKNSDFLSSDSLSATLMHQGLLYSNTNAPKQNPSPCHCSIEFWLLKTAATLNGVSGSAAAKKSQSLMLPNKSQIDGAFCKSVVTAWHKILLVCSKNPFSSIAIFRR